MPDHRRAYGRAVSVGLGAWALVALVGPGGWLLPDPASAVRVRSPVAPAATEVTMDVPATLPPDAVSGGVPSPVPPSAAVWTPSALPVPLPASVVADIRQVEQVERELRIHAARHQELAANRSRLDARERKLNIEVTARKQSRGGLMDDVRLQGAVREYSEVLTERQALDRLEARLQAVDARLRVSLRDAATRAADGLARAGDASARTGDVAAARILYAGSFDYLRRTTTVDTPTRFYRALAPLPPLGPNLWPDASPDQVKVAAAIWWDLASRTKVAKRERERALAELQAERLLLGQLLDAVPEPRHPGRRLRRHLDQRIQELEDAVAMLEARFRTHVRRAAALDRKADELRVDLVFETYQAQQVEVPQP